jgi:uncharacterized protein YjbK
MTKEKKTMSTNIEIESKVLLTKEDFEKVIDALHADRYKRVKQINHYIDSEDQVLRRLGCALRIREKDDFVLTLKTPLSEGLLEKSQTISWRQYDRLSKNNIFPDGDIKNFLEILGIKIENLKILTSLTTDRIEIPYKEGLFSLDKNEYSGTIDYELEMEQTSIQYAEECLEEICALAGVPCVFNTFSKQARAMNALKK